MKKTREQREKELEAKVREVIQKLLDWEEANQAPDLTQIEDVVLELREELGRAMARSLIGNQANVAPAEGVRCKRCGREMRNKGQKVKVIESRAGELALERGYYYCPECGTGVFPPGSTVESGGKTLE